jgi:hypothetical protein
VNVELSREAAEALYRLPLSGSARRQLVREVERADSRFALAQWAVDYLALAAQQPQGGMPNYLLGASVRFEHGRMTVAIAPRA